MYAEKLLPHDLEAEEAVVGSVLIDGESFTRVAPMLQSADFYRERNQLCYAAAMALFQRDEAIDQLTLAGELSRNGQLESVGGMAYLSHLVSITPTSAHSEDYAKVVSRTSVMRKLIDAASRISAMGYEDTDDVDATLRQAEDVLFTVRGNGTERGFIPLRQIYDQYLEDRAAIVEPLAAGGGPVMSGFTDLDELLGGIQRSDMVILGARPALGKSTLALNICLNAAKNGSISGVFSLEMGREQLALRILASRGWHRLPPAAFGFAHLRRGSTGNRLHRAAFGPARLHRRHTVPRVGGDAQQGAPAVLGARPRSVGGGLPSTSAGGGGGATTGCRKSAKFPGPSRGWPAT